MTTPTSHALNETEQVAFVHIKKGPKIDGIGKEGFFLSSVAALAFRDVISPHVDTTAWVRFAASDPESRIGKRMRQEILRKRDLTRLYASNTATDNSIPPNADGQVAEVRAVLAYDISARARAQTAETLIPEGYILVGPLVTASVCTIARADIAARKQSDVPDSRLRSHVDVVVAEALNQYDQLKITSI